MPFYRPQILQHLIIPKDAMLWQSFFARDSRVNTVQMLVKEDALALPMPYEEPITARTWKVKR
jgi:hypothetical protein